MYHQTPMPLMAPVRPFYAYPPREQMFEAPPMPTHTQKPTKPRKLRSACDACHTAKIKCSGGIPCARCTKDSRNCKYSFTARVGKPKGSKNKKTLEKERLQAQQRAQQQQQQQEAGETSESKKESSPKPKQLRSPTQTQSPPPSAASSSTHALPACHDADYSPSFPHIQPVPSLSPYPEPAGPIWSFDPAGTVDWIDPLAHSPASAAEDVFMPPSIHLPYPPIPTPMTHPSLHEPIPEQPEDMITDNDSEHPDANSFSRRPSIPLTPNSTHRPPYYGSNMHSPVPLALDLQQQQPQQQAQQQTQQQQQTSCNCLQDAASRLVSLRDIEGRGSPPPLDAVIHYATLTLSETRSTLACAACTADPQVAQVALMCLQTVFRWANMSISDGEALALTSGACTPQQHHAQHHALQHQHAQQQHSLHQQQHRQSISGSSAGDVSPSRLPDVDVHIGAYPMSPDVAGYVKGALVGRIFGDARGVLAGLGERLAAMAPEEAQVYFLPSSLGGLKAQLDLLERSLGPEEGGRAGTAGLMGGVGVVVGEQQGVRAF